MFNVIMNWFYILLRGCVWTILLCCIFEKVKAKKGHINQAHLFVFSVIWNKFWSDQSNAQHRPLQTFRFLVNNQQIVQSEISSFLNKINYLKQWNCMLLPKSFQKYDFWQFAGSSKLRLSHVRQYDVIAATNAVTSHRALLDNAMADCLTC